MFSDIKMLFLTTAISVFVYLALKTEPAAMVMGDHKTQGAEQILQPASASPESLIRLLVN